MVPSKYSNLNFSSIKNINIRVEVKFFLSERLKNKTYSIGSVFDGYAKSIKHFGDFISLKYPHLLSIIVIPKEKS